VNLNLSHRAPTGRATIVRDKKSLVNLGRNLMQPLLGAICPILIIPEIGREFVYPAVGGSKLIRKFCSGLSCRLEVRLSCIGSPVDEPKNGVPHPVQLIGFRICILPLRCIRNNGSRHICLTRTYLKIADRCRSDINAE
jgi:hypothetical protein